MTSSIGFQLLGRLGMCSGLLCALLVIMQLRATMCNEDDGRDNSKCDQHQLQCKPIGAHSVLDGVFDDTTSGQIDNALYCLKRCVRPVDLRLVKGPRMLRLNWDLVEAKLADENLGAMVDFDELKANERHAKEARAEVNKGKGSNENNGNAFGREMMRHKRQATHDDECLREEIGGSLEDLIAECQASQSAMRFRRFKRSYDFHDRAVQMEMSDLFMLKYADEVIDHFCPHSSDVMTWCMDTAMQGNPLPTEFAEPEELKTLYCEKHDDCVVLAGGCTKERTSDVMEMCKCFRGLYDKVQASSCPGAKQAFDRVPGQCSDKFMSDIEAYEHERHASCAADSAAMTSDDVIELLGGKLE